MIITSFTCILETFFTTLVIYFSFSFWALNPRRANSNLCSVESWTAIITFFSYILFFTAILDSLFCYAFMVMCHPHASVALLALFFALRGQTLQYTSWKLIGAIDITTHVSLELISTAAWVTKAQYTNILCVFTIMGSVSSWAFENVSFMSFTFDIIEPNWSCTSSHFSINSSRLIRKTHLSTEYFSEVIID